MDPAITSQLENKESSKADIQIKNLDLNKFLIYVLLFLNLGGEIWPRESKSDAEMMDKINAMNLRMERMENNFLLLQNGVIRKSSGTQLSDKQINSDEL